MFSVKNGNLQADLGTILALRRKEDAIHGRLGTAAVLKESERLIQHAAKTVQFGHHLTQFRIFTDREVPGIFKRGIEVELKANLDHAARPLIHQKRVMIETQLPSHDHVA